jgi:hypothetical protein
VQAELPLAQKPENQAEPEAAFPAEAAACQERSNLVWAGFLLGLVLPAQRF